MSEQELLMKIANGEIEDKTKVKFDDDIIYEYWEEDNKLHRFSANEQKFKKGITRLFSDGRLGKMVEIIEEDKEIELIPYHYNLGYINCGDLKREVVEELSKNFNYFKEKINELIEAVNELKKGK